MGRDEAGELRGQGGSLLSAGFLDGEFWLDWEGRELARFCSFVRGSQGGAPLQGAPSRALLASLESIQAPGPLRLSIPFLRFESSPCDQLEERQRRAEEAGKLQRGGPRCSSSSQELPAAAERTRVNLEACIPNPYSPPCRP